MKRYFFLLLFLFFSCSTVKPYQRVYLNQEEMKLASKKIRVFDNLSESYREGSSGANGGKAGGGCGCN